MKKKRYLERVIEESDYTYHWWQSLRPIGDNWTVISVKHKNGDKYYYEYDSDSNLINMLEKIGDIYLLNRRYLNKKKW